MSSRVRSDALLSDPAFAKAVVKDIEADANKINRPIKIMEVCGTHTVALRRSGVHSLLPSLVRLISGPGCPVCVTPASYIDNAFVLAEEKNCVVVSFGDMLKVPGIDGRSLSSLQSSGKVRIVYSPLELLEICKTEDRQVVFLGIGFETTIPTVAAAFRSALDEGIHNLSLYTAFKTVPTALQVLLSREDQEIDGFLLPGHVSVILGKNAYAFLEEPGGIPGAIAGFDPLDMLLGIRALVAQVKKGEQRVENLYTRAVRDQGNRIALELMDSLLEPCNALWRGLGEIPQSGLGLKREFREYDAENRFSLPPMEDYEIPGCLCGEVIQGISLPTDCQLFGAVCTPEQPVGPCMVSSEGTCAAFLRFRGAME